MAILYEFQQTITNRLHLASYGVGGNQKLKKKNFVIKIMMIIMRYKKSTFSN